MEWTQLLEWLKQFSAVHWILLVNTVFSLGLTVYGLFNRKGRRCELVALGLLCAICPVVLPVLLGMIRMIEFFTRSQEVDMNEISFDQKREEQAEVPDAGVELDYVSMQDAMRLSSVSEQRRLLLNVMKYNASMTLTSMVEVINSPDTETSHFAAAAIQDALSEFRMMAQKLINNMKAYPDDVEVNLMALEYIYQCLKMKIMSPVEQQSYVYTENSVAENLFQRNPWFMIATHYLWMVTLLIDIKDLGLADTWVSRANQYRPNELDTYKAMRRLHYARGDQEGFLACIDRFRKSDLSADQ